MGTKLGEEKKAADEYYESILNQIRARVVERNEEFENIRERYKHNFIMCDHLIRVRQARFILETADLEAMRIQYTIDRVIQSLSPPVIKMMCHD
jgi:hypothetical protein